MLILASASPRRRDLLAEAGIDFRIVTADIDEWEPERGDPDAVARANAEAKAKAVAAREPDSLVLGADTVVALGDELLGKPKDGADARRILERLSGTTHSVCTGVALASTDRLDSRVVRTRITMRPWTSAEIDAYIESGEAFGKAGAYAIQESADRFVVERDGPFDNVVGLPIAAVKEMLAQWRD